jgi:hypothetical protein
MAEQEDVRAVKLTKLFNATIHGHRDLKSSADGNRFLEALCSQKDVSKCVECLIAAPEGLCVVAKAFRFVGNSNFLNGPATSVLRHLSDPSLKQLYSGRFLQLVLEKIVDPPTFWNTFVQAHDARILTAHATHAFAWLLLEILCFRFEGAPDVREVAQRLTIDDSFINSSSLETRNLGHRIKHIIDSTSSDPTEEGPGGRHDNDFVNYREIKILPTPDEFASAEQPFYRRADAIVSTQAEDRGLRHLDNQFRLLREDLVGELRNDFQIATGQKKGRRRAVIDNLEFHGLDCGTEQKRKACAVKFLCSKDISQMAHLKTTTLRKQYIVDKKSFIKHQSFGCLISNRDVIAFATIRRDEDLLARQPAVLVLEIADDTSFRKVLIAGKSSADLQFVQVDTAVFAYKPFLKCLQTMTELPMQNQLLNLGSESSEVLSGIEPTRIVEKIRDNRGSDLQSTLGTTKSVLLDAAQAESLLSGLTQKVSLIQGPPGKIGLYV